MTDRLPMPMNDAASHDAKIVERASATPTRAISRETEAAAKARPRKITAKKANAKNAPPTTLADVQSWMVAAITETEPDADELERVFTAGPRLSAQRRFDVYRVGYHARLLECLRDDYPILAETVGEDRFEALCRAYVGAHPSRTPNLNAFGRHMSAFCREVPVRDLGIPRAFAAGLAALEWALVEVLHAETPAPFDLAALQAIPIEAWAGARFVRSDAARLLAFDYPINQYFQACRMDERPKKLPARSKTSTIVYRRDLTLWRMDLTPATRSILGALLEGVPIGEALERMGIDETDPEALAEAERSVMVWFREWVNAGLFAGIVLEP